MKIHYGFEEGHLIKNAVITTGSFDGVHLGHKVIINRIINIAKDIDGESALITFHPHPRKILFPETAGKDLKLISSQREKIVQLAQTGIDHLIIVEFTKAFAQISSSEFIEDILLKKLNAKKIVIGFNHHFGRNREGDYDKLVEMGKEHAFDFEEIPEQDVENEAVSSTKIRKALLEGNIQRANAYLDHQYIIISNLSKGQDTYSKQGFKTLNAPIDEDTKLVPPDGTYAISIKNKDIYSKGMAIINRNLNDGANIFNHVEILPFDIQTSSVEGLEATIYFHKRISFFETENQVNPSRELLTKDKELIEELIY